MKYRKCVCNGYIVAAGSIGNGVPITDDEYREIVSMMKQIPVPPPGYVFKLKDATREWVPVQLPPVTEPELTDEEALDIILGGAT